MAVLWMRLQAASRATLSAEMKQDLHVAFASCFISVATVALGAATGKFGDCCKATYVTATGLALPPRVQKGRLLNINPHHKQ
jgi:hypothetical protein